MIYLCPIWPYTYNVRSTSAWYKRFTPAILYAVSFPPLSGFAKRVRKVVALVSDVVFIFVPSIYYYYYYYYYYQLNRWATSHRREATDTIARGGRATRRQSRTADHTHAPQPPLVRRRAVSRRRAVLTFVLATATRSKPRLFIII